MSIARVYAVVTVVLLATGCRAHSEEGGEEILPTLPPAATVLDTVVVAIPSAVPYQGYPGWQLDRPIQVRVQRTDGTPVSGVTVQWGSGTSGAHFPSNNEFGIAPVYYDPTNGLSVSDSNGVASIAYAPGFVTGMTLVDAVIPGARASVAVQVLPARDMKEIAGTDTRWCGIDAAGVLSCWMHFTDYDATIPTRMTAAARSLDANTSERFRLIRAGGSTFCALTVTDALYCWDNLDFGPKTSATAALATPRPVPTPASFHDLAMTGPGWVDVDLKASSIYRLCGIENGGVTWCTGSLTGDGTSNKRNDFYRIPGVLFRQLSLSGGEACGAATDGLAWCWGRTSDVGPVEHAPTLLRPARVGGDRHYTMVVQLAYGACGIEEGSQQLFCWAGIHSQLLDRPVGQETYLTQPVPFRDGRRASWIDAAIGNDGRLQLLDGNRNASNWGDFLGITDATWTDPRPVRAILNVENPVSRGGNYFCYRIGSATGPIGCTRNSEVFTGIPLRQEP